jgi:hypothetical protein
VLCPGATRDARGSHADVALRVRRLRYGLTSGGLKPGAYITHLFLFLPGSPVRDEYQYPGTSDRRDRRYNLRFVTAGVYIAAIISRNSASGDGQGGDSC